MLDANCAGAPQNRTHADATLSARPDIPLTPCGHEAHTAPLAVNRCDVCPPDANASQWRGSVYSAVFTSVVMADMSKFSPVMALYMASTSLVVLSK
jgi:hypothetical protein